LYYALLEQGQMRRLVSEEAIEQAMHNPPMDTRAAIRGLCVQRFAEQIETLNWERILLRHADQTVRLDLSRLVEQDVRPLSRRLTAAPDVTTFVRMVKEFA
jgi:proteasome accessory factor A